MKNYCFEYWRNFMGNFICGIRFKNICRDAAYSLNFCFEYSEIS